MCNTSTNAYGGGGSEVVLWLLKLVQLNVNASEVVTGQSASSNSSPGLSTSCSDYLIFLDEF